MSVFDLQRGEAALREHNKTALYEGILDTCTEMRKKLELLQSGRLKRAVTHFRVPGNHKNYVRVIQTVEDGRLKTNFWMDDSAVWRYCAERRRQHAEFRRHGAATGSDQAFREYFQASWLLEVYVLFKYGIDLRNSDWCDPTHSDFRKVSWIMDNDDFAQRYKLTTYSESRGIADPFNTISVDMAGLDLSAVINKDYSTKDTTNDGASSPSQSQTTTNTSGLDAGHQVSPQCQQ